MNLYLGNDGRTIYSGTPRNSFSKTIHSLGSLHSSFLSCITSLAKEIIHHRYLNCTINFLYFNPPNANPTGMVLTGATQYRDPSKEPTFHKHFSAAQDEVKRSFYFSFLYCLISFFRSHSSLSHKLHVFNLPTDLFSFTGLRMRTKTTTYMWPQRYKRLISNK